MKPKALVFALIVAFGLAFWVARMSAIAVPAVSDNKDTADIQSTIERFYGLLEDPDSLRAAGKLHTVLADTQDYPLRPEHKAAIQQAFGAPVPTHGYMTSVSATLTVLGRANTQYVAAKDKARSEGRELTTDELRDLGNKTGGLGGFTTGNSGKPQTIKFTKITVTGNTAKAEYTTMASIQEVTLIKRDTRWYITGLTILKNLF